MINFIGHNGEKFPQFLQASLTFNADLRTTTWPAGCTQGSPSTCTGMSVSSVIRNWDKSDTSTLVNITVQHRRHILQSIKYIYKGKAIKIILWTMGHRILIFVSVILSGNQAMKRFILMIFMFSCIVISIFHWVYCNTLVHVLTWPPWAIRIPARRLLWICPMWTTPVTPTTSSMPS